MTQNGKSFRKKQIAKELEVDEKTVRQGSMKPRKTSYRLFLVMGCCIALFSSCGTSTIGSPSTPTPAMRTPPETNTALPSPAATSTASPSPTATNTVLPTPQPTSSPGACAAWRTVASPNVGTSATLHGVAVLSTNDAWAVGSYSNGQSSFTLVVHWNGTQWAVVASPNVAGSTGNELLSVVAVTANDIWAVGDSSNMQKTLIEHWNGAQWAVVASPNVAPTGNTLASISIDSATDIWAVGTTTSTSSSSGYQPLIEHWNGTTWSISSSPVLSGRLFSVVAINSNNVWAVGADIMPNVTDALIEHWNGAQWSTVSGANPGVAFNSLNAVVNVTGGNIWAAGDYSNSVGPGADYTPLVEYWNGSKWSAVHSPFQGTSDLVNGMAASSSSDITIVGDYRAGIDPMGPYYTLVEHWNGAQWSVVNSPSPGSIASNLLAAANVANSGDAWAVGSTYGLNSGQNNIYQTLTEFHC